MRYALRWIVGLWKTITQSKHYCPIKTAEYVKLGGKIDHAHVYHCAVQSRVSQELGCKCGRFVAGCRMSKNHLTL